MRQILLGTLLIITTTSFADNPLYFDQKENINIHAYSDGGETRITLTSMKQESGTIEDCQEALEEYKTRLIKSKNVIIHKVRNCKEELFQNQISPGHYTNTTKRMRERFVGYRGTIKFMNLGFQK